MLNISFRFSDSQKKKLNLELWNYAEKLWWDNDDNVDEIKVHLDRLVKKARTIHKKRIDKSKELNGNRTPKPYNS